jgi:hypothetical protein
MNFPSRLIAAGVAVACTLPTTLVRAADPEPALSLSAVAVIPEDSTVPARTEVGSVTVVIDRWSTEPADASLATLPLTTPAVGTIRRGALTVASILYAREEEDSKTKGRRVVIVTDRPLRAWALGPDPGIQSVSEVAVVEIQLSKGGKGEGRSGDFICLAAVSEDLEIPVPYRPDGE